MLWCKPSIPVAVSHDPRPERCRASPKTSPGRPPRSTRAHGERRANPSPSRDRHCGLSMALRLGRDSSHTTADGPMSGTHLADTGSRVPHPAPDRLCKPRALKHRSKQTSAGLPGSLDTVCPTRTGGDHSRDEHLPFLEQHARWRSREPRAGPANQTASLRRPFTAIWRGSSPSDGPLLARGEDDAMRATECGKR